MKLGCVFGDFCVVSAKSWMREEKLILEAKEGKEKKEKGALRV